MIKYLVLDVDGTLTDGKIYMSQEGELMKAFCARDGHALARILPKTGITPVIVTGRESQIVRNRAQELRITEVYQGVADKRAKLAELAAQYGCGLDSFAYAGDDLNDIEALTLCGFRACPVDAVDEIKAVCDFVSAKKGGEGAVREIIEELVKRRSEGTL